MGEIVSCDSVSLNFMNGFSIEVSPFPGSRLGFVRHKYW